MKQNTEFIINSFIFIFFLKNSIIKIIIYVKHNKQKTGNIHLSIALGPLTITNVTKNIKKNNNITLTYLYIF